MIDPVSAWAFGAIAGGAVGFWIGRWWPRFSRYSRRSITCRASSGLRSDPAKWQRLMFDEPDWFEHDLAIRLDPGSVQRGNGHGGPTTPKPAIVPKPQFPSPRVIPGDTP